MSKLKLFSSTVFIALLSFGSSTHGAESGLAQSKSMNMEDPMPTKMAKPGMKKGDVKKAARKKGIEMKESMEKETAGGAKKN